MTTGPVAQRPRDRGPLVRLVEKGAYPVGRSLTATRLSDERRFCGCGAPWLWRLGECLEGHPLATRVLVRRNGGCPQWIELRELRGWPA